MEHTTFAKKTVVLAALGALSLMAATARADGTETPSDPKPKKIEVTVGSEGVLGIASEIKTEETSVTWNDEWLKKESVLGENESFGGLTVGKGDNDANTITVTGGGSLTIDLPTDEESAKVVKFDSVGLNVTDGGTFKNSSHVTFQNGSLTVEDGAFTNEEGGVIELVGSADSPASFTLSVTEADSVKNFTNEGKIVLGSKAHMTVGSGANPFGVETEDTLALNVGNVEIGKGATLTNQDKGYQLTKETDGEGGDDGAETGEAQTLVHFGTVTVADGGKFVNASGALSEGETLFLQAENTAEIDGTSVWGTLQLSQIVAEGKKLSDFVDIKKNADFRVTGG